MHSVVGHKQHWFALTLEYVLVLVLLLLIDDVVSDWDSWWTYEGISGQCSPLNIENRYLSIIGIPMYSSTCLILRSSNCFSPISQNFGVKF